MSGDRVPAGIALGSAAALLLLGSHHTAVVVAALAAAARGVLKGGMLREF
jgi:hypothetical protein